MKRIAAFMTAAALLLCPGLSVSAEEIQPEWTLEEHVLTVRGTGLLKAGAWADEADEIYEIVLEEGITGIAEEGLSGYRNLQKITLPSTFRWLYPRALADDSALTEIEGLEYITEFDFQCLTGTAYIAEHPFIINRERLWYAEGTELTVPEGVRIIMPYAFGNLTGGEYIAANEQAENVYYDIVLPEGVEIIGEYAFAFCATMEHINLPESVREIGEYAFLDCANLHDLTLGENVETVGDYAFLLCPELQALTVQNPETAFGVRAYGYSYDYSAQLAAQLSTEEELAALRQKTALRPHFFEELAAVFVMHWRSPAYSEINWRVTFPITDPASAYIIRTGRIIGPSGSAAQTYARRNSIPFYPTEAPALRGDVNLDGEIDIMDVILLNRWLTNTAQLTAEQLLSADLNEDGVTDSIDSLAILRRHLLS